MESADLRRWRPRHDPPGAGGAARSKPITNRHARDSSPVAHAEFGSFWRRISSVVSSRGSERRVERCGHPFPTRTHLLRLSRQNLSPFQANTTASSQGLTIMLMPGRGILGRRFFSDVLGADLAWGRAAPGAAAAAYDELALRPRGAELAELLA